MEQKKNDKNKVSAKANDQYPVQRVAYKEPLDEKVVKEAVEEINPDRRSMISRG